MLRSFRYLCLAGVLALAPSLGLAQAPQKAPPPVPPADPLNVDWACRVAAQFLKDADGLRDGKGVLLVPGHGLFAVSDAPYLQFFHWVGFPEEKLDEAHRILRWWLNQMSFAPAPGLVRDVPGSKGRVQWVDIRQFRWSRAAWDAVGSREPYTFEPLVDHDIAQYLRDRAGVVIERRKVAHDRFPVVSVVWAPWLFRDTIETDRSPSYYDLSFSRQRFGDKVFYKASKDKAGKSWPAGWYYRGGSKVKSGFVDANFPRDQKDWDRAFGVDLARVYEHDQVVDLTFGSVVEGGKDDPVKGSIVALNNRLLVTTESPFGSMQSFDVFDSAGKRDYVSQVAKLPFQVRRQTVFFDASESLAYTPMGGQMSFLSGGDGKRVEIAANKAASDQSADHRLNAGVRNPGSCMICHGPHGGYILPRNVVKEMVEAGVDFELGFEPEQVQRFVAFYLEWERKVKRYQVPYQDLVERLTRDPLPAKAEFVAALRDNDLLRLKKLQDRADKARRSKGWTGAEMAKKFQALRDWFDDPLPVEQQAAELGVPVVLYRQLAARSDNPRLNWAAQGRAISRRPWEVEFFRRMALHLDANRQ